jgi:hypothetical protein
MRKLVLFSVFLSVVSISYAQESLQHQLIASRNRNKHVFNINSAVKCMYNKEGQVLEVKGRIAEITATSIIIQPFNKRDVEHTTIPLNDLVLVRKKARTGRVFTGALAGVIGIGGMRAIMEDMSDRGEFLDGLGATIGGFVMLLGSVPYIIVAASEPVTSKEKGYQFAIVPR